MSNNTKALMVVANSGLRGKTKLPSIKNETAKTYHAVAYRIFSRPLLPKPNHMTG